MRGGLPLYVVYAPAARRTARCYAVARSSSTSVRCGIAGMASRLRTQGEVAALPGREKFAASSSVTSLAALPSSQKSARKAPQKEPPAPVATKASAGYPDPVFDERSRVLVLGSFPSVLSRENSFYYGNPRNRF